MSTRRKPVHPDYGITRIDHRGTHAWWVRLRQNQGHHYRQKSFPDRRYGGQRAARQAARAWRDQVRAELEVAGLVCPLKPGREPTFAPTARSATGIAGVVLQPKFNSGYPSLHWCGQWWVAGKRYTRSFSVRRYGWRGAFLWAVKSRADALGLNVNLRRQITPSPPPEWHSWLADNDCLRRVLYRDFEE